MYSTNSVVAFWISDWNVNTKLIRLVLIHKIEFPCTIYSIEVFHTERKKTEFNFSGFFSFKICVVRFLMYLFLLPMFVQLRPIYNWNSVQRMPLYISWLNAWIIFSALLNLNMSPLFRIMFVGYAYNSFTDSTEKFWSQRTMCRLLEFFRHLFYWIEELGKRFLSGITHSFDDFIFAIDFSIRIWKSTSKVFQFRFKLW